MVHYKVEAIEDKERGMAAVKVITEDLVDNVCKWLVDIMAVHLDTEVLPY